MATTPPKKAKKEMLEVIETKDGAHTLRFKGSSTTYRSVYGAHTESKHVFLRASGIADIQRDVSVLELGLGTGLNFLHTAEYFLQSSNQFALYYTAIERSPLPQTCLEEVHRNHDFQIPLLSMLMDGNSQAANSRKPLQIKFKNIYLRTLPWDLFDCDFPASSFDTHYHDPFGPKENPDAWTDLAFKHIAPWLRSTARLVTYSASSEIRKSLARAGFWTAKAPGGAGKREMTIASPNANALQGFSLLPKSKQPIGVDLAPSNPKPPTP
ncbi:MAG: tRNA (5-methylaminomethyl-2-thiouridine)(34)-methyltransferase MnmD [Myxococcota bacterium]|nr:tRNA (5-methylaminomethyl-2-thiouridine)(34)-methyltransferase MnmD [Myxococcota bacterium]